MLQNVASQHFTNFHRNYFSSTNILESLPECSLQDCLELLKMQRDPDIPHQGTG